MKKTSALLLSAVLTVSPVLPVMADDAVQITQETPDLLQGEHVTSLRGGPFYVVTIPDREDLRWNLTNLGKYVGDCAHLDELDGFNFPFRIEQSSMHPDYMTFRMVGSDYYVDSKGDNSKTGEVLHNGHTHLSQDNQHFRLVPVRDENNQILPDRYYILSKKGDNAGFDLYAGMEDDKSVKKDVKVATTKKPFVWIIKPFYDTLPENAMESLNGKLRISCKDANGNKYYLHITNDRNHKLYLAPLGDKYDAWLVAKAPGTGFFTFNLICHDVMTQQWQEYPSYISIKDRAYGDGKSVHSFGDDQVEDMTRNWHVIDNGDGTVYLQNALTKMYMAPEEDNLNGSKLVTSSNPVPFQLELEKQSVSLGAADGSWNKSEDGWQFIRKDGSLLKNANLNLDGIHYLLDENGIMQTGWQKSDGEASYYDASGARKSGWLNKDGVWYFLEANGLLKTGWHEENENHYFLDLLDGAMKTGKFTDAEGKEWQADENGVLLS